MVRLNMEKDTKSVLDFRWRSLMSNRVFLSHSSSDKEAVGIPSRENKLGMKFAPIMRGTFLIGSEKGETHERTVRSKTVTPPFYMGVYTVTQAQWRTVMDTEPWKGYPRVREGDNYPVV